MYVVAQHADENGNETDRLANDRTDGYVVDVVDQPCGRGDQAELTGAARILQHKGDGERGHTDHGQNLDQEVDRGRRDAEYGEAQNVEYNVAGNEAAKPQRMRGVKLFFKQK